MTSQQRCGSVRWRISILMVATRFVLVFGSEAGAAEPTFAKEIAPILQNHCERCHRPGSIAPMPLITYEQVRPYARAIKLRTSLRDKPGVMPPWHIEKNIGIQRFKDDPSLSESQIQTIGEWVDNGAPFGNPADMPEPITWRADNEWTIGEPDLIVKSKPFSIAALGPDWWGPFESVPTGQKEDRYIAAYEVREVNDARTKPELVTGGARPTAGLSVIHHGTVTVVGPDSQSDAGGCCGAHEVGRNAEVFDPKIGKLMRAGAKLAFQSVHMHANGRDTTGHLEIAFKFHPRRFKPEFVAIPVSVTTQVGLIDIPGGAADVQIDSTAVLQQNTKLTVFEPHMHAAGVRFCLHAIYGSVTETINCAGYDHNWVLAYTYADDAAPLLPKGTILRVIGYYNNTHANRNVPEPRNWSGGGHRSVDNMNNMLGQGIGLTDEQFATAVAERREQARLSGHHVVLGCPTCALTNTAHQSASTTR